MGWPLLLSRICPSSSPLGSPLRGGGPWDSEGPTERNLALLQHVAAKLALLTGPWVLGGDFNMTPAVLGATGWLGLVRGVVVAPQAATCGTRCLDYFVVSANFAHVVAGIAVVGDAPFKPHSPVRIYLRPRPRAIMVRRVLMPAALGAVYPAGPVNRKEGNPSTLGSPARDVPQCARGEWSIWDAEYGAWMEDAERELVDLLGLTGQERDKHCGRARGPRVRWEPVIGPTARAQLLVNSATSTWRKAAAALYDIALFHRARARNTAAEHSVGNARAVAVAAIRRISALRFRAIAADPRLGTVPPQGATVSSRMGDTATGRGSGHAPCPSVTDWITLIQPARLFEPTYTEDLLTAARQFMRRCEAACARHRTRQWVEWLHEGPAKGLGRQHAYSRLPHGWVPSRVANRSAVPELRERDMQMEELWLRRRSLTAADDGTMRPLNAQEVVDAEAIVWAKHWLADQ